MKRMGRVDGSVDGAFQKQPLTVGGRGLVASETCRMGRDLSK